MERILFDAETHWDPANGYTLKEMTYVEYIRDLRFQLMCGVLIRESEQFKPKFYRGPALIQQLRAIDWTNTELIAHNQHFDGLMLAMHLGIFPARYTCTLAYSRYWNKGETDHGLDALAKFYGLEGKTDGLQLTKGKRLEDMTELDWMALEPYTVNDGKLGLYIWLKLQHHIPEDERVIQDMTFRMATQPTLMLNQTLVSEAIEEAKQKNVDSLGTYDLKMLRSRPKFAAALEALGVEVPMKYNDKNVLTYAFSKKDQEFLDLQDHQNEDVRDLVEAKMAASSNIDLTRAQRFRSMGDKLYVTLNPSAARTDRWGGAGGTNVQNLRRGGKLRKSITAPPGYLIYAPDQAQIECRINAAISGHEALVEAFRQKRDIYSEMATDLFGYPVNRKFKAPDGSCPHEDEGFLGKTVILGCGYQTGGLKLQQTLSTSEKKLKLPIERCFEIVNTYRAKHWPIPVNWQRQQDNLLRMCDHNGAPFEYMWMEFRPKEHRVYWPDGSSLYYPGIHLDDEGRVKYYDTHAWKDMYGGKAVEHHCQKTGNSIIKQNMIDIMKDVGVRAVNTTHDELMYLLPISEAEAMAAQILEIMCTPKSWFTSIPVFAEGKLSPFYSK